MPNEPLADPWLEAAKNILEAWYRQPYDIHMADKKAAQAMLSTAIRETKAAELAAALEEVLFEDSNKSDQDRIVTRLKARLVLEKYKELANG